MNTTPRQTLYYVRRGVDHWRAYIDRRHREHAELLRSQRGPLRNPTMFEYRRKRLESAIVHAKLAIWLLENHDKHTRYAGIYDGQTWRPARVEEICRGAGIDENQLRRALRRFRISYVRRWQGRDYRPENAEQPFAGKVAITRLTLAFLQASRCAAIREQLLKRLADRAEKRRRAELAALGTSDVAAELARERAAPLALVEKVRRRARAQLGPLATDFAVWELADRLLARRRPPPN